jgi:hypothetical protein
MGGQFRDIGLESSDNHFDMFYLSRYRRAHFSYVQSYPIGWKLVKENGRQLLGQRFQKRE